MNIRKKIRKRFISKILKIKTDHPGLTIDDITYISIHKNYK